MSVYALLRLWTKPWDAIDRAHVVTMPTIQSSSEYFIFFPVPHVPCTYIVHMLCVHRLELSKWQTIQANMALECVRQPSTAAVAASILLTWTYFYWNLSNVILTHTASTFFFSIPFTNNGTKRMNQYLALSIVCRFERINWLLWEFQISQEYDIQVNVDLYT